MDVENMWNNDRRGCCRGVTRTVVCSAPEVCLLLRLWGHRLMLMQCFIKGMARRTADCTPVDPTQNVLWLSGNCSPVKTQNEPSLQISVNQLKLCEKYVSYRSYETSLVYNAVSKDFTTVDSYHRNHFIVCLYMWRVETRCSLTTEWLQT